jgi:MOSC domain-containing protein YiiM
MTHPCVDGRRVTTGVVAGLYVAPERGSPMCALGEVRAVPGKGLEGDRYFHAAGTFTGDGKRDSQVTLIALEDLRAMETETGVTLAPGAVRRNVVTEGTDLRALVGREFTLGAVRFRGTRLSEPCHHLARLTDERVVKGLVHRSGLQAQVLTEGVVRVGDAILMG